MYVVNVSAIFGRMLQMFYLGVAKIDLMVLHMLQWDLTYRSHLLQLLGDVRVVQAHC
jgi:hypothetical protein